MRQPGQKLSGINWDFYLGIFMYASKSGLFKVVCGASLLASVLFSNLAFAQEPVHGVGHGDIVKEPIDPNSNDESNQSDAPNHQD
jgi:hypothetical protein